MELTLKYGRTTMSATLPWSNVHVLAPRDYQADLPNLAERLVERLNFPHKGPALKEIIKPGEEVVVLVSDITRAWNRTSDYLPALLQYVEACGVDREQITIISARGCHRSQTQDELRTMVGDAVFARYRVLEHDADDQANLVFVGRTSRGNNVYVNKKVAEADRVILTGGVIHHAMSGFGGGRKSILPGVAGRQTVEFNHLHALHPTEMAINPAIGSNKLEGNPIHEDMVEAAALVNPDFLVNVVLDRHNEIVDFFTGHWLDAWLEGCRLVNEIYGVEVEAESDLVIVSCGGFPYDISLYQASKTFYNAGLATKPGGTMIILVQAEDGPGSSDFFGWYDHETNAEFYNSLKANFSIPGYLAYLIYNIAKSRNVYAVTDVEAESVAKMGITPVSSLQEAIDRAAAHVQTEARVCIMPEGAFTFPILKK